MKMILKLIVVCILCLAVAAITYFVGVLIYASVTAFKPAKKESLESDNRSIQIPDSITRISLLTWNTGYAGLGSGMDFFYDGGKQVRPSPEMNERYLTGIEQFLKSNDTIDIIFLQEVDFGSKRSYGKDQFRSYKKEFSNYAAFAAVNYKSGYVPVPFSEPMGKVNSGMCVFSRFQPVEAFQLATPGHYPWPKSLFMLKRCFILCRYLLKNGKELVVINLHNSAFDKDGKLRKAELESLKKILTDEFGKGNYVIAGGDWNQNPPGFDPGSILKYKGRENRPIAENYLPGGWTWAYDPRLPTNRNVDQPFDIHKTPVTIIDFFVLSPNIKLEKAETIDLGFEDSDHQPVLLVIKLQ